MDSPFPTPVSLHVFADATALADALSARVADALRARLACDATASLAVSGGRTPVRFLAALAARSLDWARVVVTLVDERWVPETSERSNAALVRRHLLTGGAGAARFIPLYGGTARPEDGIGATRAMLAAAPLPFAAAVLGMGDDGHTASFFPHAAGLMDAIDPATPDRLAIVRAEAAQEPRVTLTLPPLLQADSLLLHIEGNTKREVLEQACGRGPEAEMPIRAVLRGTRAPLDIYWCP